MRLANRALVACSIAALACSGTEPPGHAAELAPDLPAQPEPVVSVPAPALAQPADDPLRLHPDTPVATLFAITGDAEGGLVAVGSLGTIMVSHDRGRRWERVASGTTKELFATWHADDGTTWAVGGSGTILRSRDRGWTEVPSGTNATLRHVVGNGSELIAAGEQGTILRSSDGGDTWQRIAMPALPPAPRVEPPREPPRPVDFPAQRHEPSEAERVRALWSEREPVLGLGSPQRGEIWVLLAKLLWRTTDGGASWKVVARLPRSDDRFEHLQVVGGDDPRFVATGSRERDPKNPIDPYHFVASGRADAIDHMVPLRDRLIGPPVIAIAPRSDTIAAEIYLAGDGYDVFWSSDGGASFAGSEQSVALQSPYALGKRALWVAPDGAVFAAGEHGALMRSSDRARTWELLVEGVREPLFGGALSRDGRSIFAAVAGAVLRGRADSWELLAPTIDMPTGDGRSVGVRRGLRACCTDVWVGDDGVIVAAGDGVIWRSEDDGKRWSEVVVDDKGRCCWSLWGDATTVHGIGDDVVVSSSDGGEHWSSRKLPATAGDRMTLAGLGERLYAAGGKGVIVRSDDGGKHWSTEPTGTSEYLYGAFVGKNASGVVTAWAVGEHGTVLRSIDAGPWTEVDVGIDTRLLAMWGDTTRGELYVVGEVGVLRSTDDGATWAPILPGHRNLRSAFGDGRGRVLALGESGEVLRVPPRD